MLFQYCLSQGYILAEINSCAENDEVLQYLKLTDTTGNKKYWLGLTDTAIEGQFVWQTAGNNAGYTNWNNGEPNNSGGNEDCVGMDVASTYRRWNDDSCAATTYHALCQKGNLLNY